MSLKTLAATLRAECSDLKPNLPRRDHLEFRVMQYEVCSNHQYSVMKQLQITCCVCWFVRVVTFRFLYLLHSLGHAPECWILQKNKKMMCHFVFKQNQALEWVALPSTPGPSGCRSMPLNISWLAVGPLTSGEPSRTERWKKFENHKLVYNPNHSLQFIDDVKMSCSHLETLFLGSAFAGVWMTSLFLFLNAIISFHISVIGNGHGPLAGCKPKMESHREPLPLTWGDIKIYLW